MTTTIQNLSDLQDRRIMMDKKLPPYGYAFVILTGLFMIFLVIWSTQTNRIYVSQNSGVVQAANKVQGCASQVWLVSHAGDGADPLMTFEGDSDAHIVRGLVAIVLAIYSGKRASEVARLDALETFRSIGMIEHLSAQRANGLRSMVTAGEATPIWMRRPRGPSALTACAATTGSSMPANAPKATNLEGTSVAELA